MLIITAKNSSTCLRSYSWRKHRAPKTASMNQVIFLALCESEVGDRSQRQTRSAFEQVSAADSPSQQHKMSP